ncbi:serine/threonine-protein kinase-like protein ACR4 isoform X2 [Daucus carota subsp. sativus]|uniref:serine/threonine-protein kinase-like protein ACR4 isoform X2 n=1 Tax=Daucus carota subsp. sativus TaxID=79200 RepID=UPI003083D639
MTTHDVAYDISLSFLILSFVVLVIILIIILCNKKQVKGQEILPTRKSAHIYSLIDVDEATEGFSTRRLVGQGRLGTVYTGVMSRGDMVIVKRIHPRLVLSNAGFSEAPGERIIVSEFVGMISLEFYLHGNSEGVALLDWGNRLKVAAGLARGIEHLHEVVMPPIVHGCVKSSNVLIDLKFVAKICDYGLSFLTPQEKEGLVGYVDDEFWINKKGASKESDVYGLGVVLLEILSGRRSGKGFNIVEWALPLIKETKISQLLDTRIVIPSDMKPLVRLAKVAAACVGNSRKNRPSIVQVVAILNNLEEGALFISFGSL